jgi:excisionase family DNA binding protein
MADNWLTVKEIAEELKVEISTVQGWIREKKLIAYKVGRDYRIKREDYDRFLKERRTDKEEKT